MKTRWMIKVESKIKRGATGRTLLFWSLAPWCLLRTDWSEVWTDSRYDWYFEFILIFWVHSTTTGASLDISLLLINTNQFAHERSNHSTYSITHGRGWVLDSFSNRYIRTQAHEWVLDDFPYRYIRTVCIHTNDSEHLNESWMSSSIDLTLESLVFNSRSYCYGANSCFDRSNNQSLHSLFKEHEPWNRNFPTNNIELKRQGGESTVPSPFIWDIPKCTSNIGTVHWQLIVIATDNDQTTLILLWYAPYTLQFP